MSTIIELKSSPEAVDSKLDNLFENSTVDGETAVELPSKGLVYTGFGGVYVTPLKYEDEYQIFASVKSGSDPVNQIIEKCTRGIRVPDLLPHDKLYLLMKIREVSYGNTYEFERICPNCGGSTKAGISISDIPVEQFPNNFKDVREVILPKLNKPITLRAARVADFGAATEMDINFLGKFVISLCGDTDPVFINKALRRMSIVDVKFIKESILLDQYGLQTSFLFECSHCHNTAEMEIPLTSDFFSVS